MSAMGRTTAGRACARTGAGQYALDGLDNSETESAHAFGEPGPAADDCTAALFEVDDLDVAPLLGCAQVRGSV